MAASALAALLGTVFILAWPVWSTPRSWSRLPYPLALLAFGLARRLFLRARRRPGP